jgi:hypothetical protein
MPGLRVAPETSPCSIWRSTASYAVATWWLSRSRDVAPHGYTIDRATVRQKKTGRPVKFELTEQTRQGRRRLPRGSRQEAGRISVHQPPRDRPGQ